jgi:hypothetical protein
MVPVVARYRMNFFTFLVPILQIGYIHLIVSSHFLDYLLLQMPLLHWMSPGDAAAVIEANFSRGEIEYDYIARNAVLQYHFHYYTH